MSEHEMNQKVAEEIGRTLCLNGHKFEFDEYVGLLDGKLITVSRDFETVLETLRAVDADPTRGMVFEVGQMADVIAFRRLLFVRNLSRFDV